MGFYQAQIVPLLINWSMQQKNLAAYRSRVIPAAEGRVLEGRHRFEDSTCHTIHQTWLTLSASNPRRSSWLWPAGSSAPPPGW
jgi:hypothetical protein